MRSDKLWRTDADFKRLPENEFSEAYAALAERQRRLNQQHSLQSKMLDRDLAELQARCPHANTEYQPDASGNNDSSTDCLDCGKGLR